MALIIRGGKDDTIQAGGGRDTVFSGGGDDWVHGGAGADSIFGGFGDDTVDGGAGADLVLGGLGTDTAVFNLTENSGGRPRRGNHSDDDYDGGVGQDTLRIELTLAEWSQPEVQAEILAYHAALADPSGDSAFTFDTMKLTVTRFEALEIYVDGVPVDLAVQEVDLSGSTTDETVDVTSVVGSQVATGSGSDTINGGVGNDTIDSGAGDDVISLGDGDDVVFAGSGSDLIIAGHAGGNDFIDGGAGIDTAWYRSLLADQSVRVDLNLLDRSSIPTAVALLEGRNLPEYTATTPVGLADGGSWVDTDVLINIENVIAGQGNDTILGNDQANALWGEAGDDALTGSGGEDTLSGDAGNDLLEGGDDQDTFSGGAGDDTMLGGGGHDTLVLSGNRSDYTVATLGGGLYSVTDNRAIGDGADQIGQIETVVFADVTVGLWALVGSLVVNGTSGNDTLSGTAAREAFFGFAGDDLITGGQEEDSFVGGAGNDTLNGGGPDDPTNQDDLNFLWDLVEYSREYREALDAGIDRGVIVNLTTGIATDTFGDTDTVIEIERVFGTPRSDTIIGSDADEAFDPHGGDDIIDGGDGWDSLNYHLTDGYYNGGTNGIDIRFSDVVAGSGTVIDPLGHTDLFTGIEEVRGTRHNDIFVAGLGTQQFRGFDGSDHFDGGTGFAIVTYHHDANYGGVDGIVADLSVIDAMGFARVIDGFGAEDWLRGIDQIRGTGAADTMIGDGADNIFSSDAGNDLLDGRAGADTLVGGLGNDTLAGGTAADTLEGGAGADELRGGAGDDALFGGIDADSFVFAAGDGHDWIHDFEYSTDLLFGDDRLVLIGGITIQALTESDEDGDGSMDTTVNFSSGDSVVLLAVSGVTDPATLL